MWSWCLSCFVTLTFSVQLIGYKNYTGWCSNRQKWDYWGIRGKGFIFLKYPIPEIPEDSEKKSGMDWVLKKISGLGRVSGTRWALLMSYREPMWFWTFNFLGLSTYDSIMIFTPNILVDYQDGLLSLGPVRPWGGWGYNFKNVCTIQHSWFYPDFCAKHLGEFSSLIVVFYTFAVLDCVVCSKDGVRCDIWDKLWGARLFWILQHSLATSSEKTE